MSIKLKFLKIFSAAAALFAGIFNLSAQYIPNSRYAGKLDPRPVKLPRTQCIPANELRGVWVATIFNLDYERPKNSAEFKKFYSNMCRNLAASGFNAIFFQVRPANDAFYPSKLNPWSRYLSGVEGQPLKGERNFDPLRFMINEAHRHHLQFHAWLNPYRVTGGTKLTRQQYLNTLASNNFARRHPHLVLDVPAPDNQRKLILDPASVQVRNFVTASVMEIVRNYPVDSIHFDDYFYPDDMPIPIDIATFRSNNPRRLPMDAWRRNNVTQLITDVHNQISRFNRQNRRKVRFGVSPFGIWRNRANSPFGSLTAGRESYSSHHADTRLWVKQRLIDYITPQIYWTFNHESAAYAALVDWWCQTVKDTGVDLYIGHSAYQLESAAWQNNELFYQLLYNRSKPEVKGSIIFSYRNLARPANQRVLKNGRKVLQYFWKRK